MCAQSLYLKGFRLLRGPSYSRKYSSPCRRRFRERALFETTAEVFKGFIRLTAIATGGSPPCAKDASCFARSTPTYTAPGSHTTTRIWLSLVPIAPLRTTKEADHNLPQR
jgi:hypothetical protein